MGYSYWNGTEAAHRRVMMKAAGYSDEDIRKKPHIGVPNSYMAGSPGTAHLRQVTEAVKEGIWAAGGIPVEFGIPATCGNVANGADEMKYEQVGRDIVAMSIEFVSRVHNFDAICCVAVHTLIGVTQFGTINNNINTNKEISRRINAINANKETIRERVKICEK